MIYRFELKGKIQPYTRTLRGQKYYDKKADQYFKSKENIFDQLLFTMMQNKWDKLPDKTPLFIGLRYTVPKRLNGFDLDNVLKAVLDASQNVVFKNDLWIHAIIGADKVLGKDYSAEYVVGEMEDDVTQKVYEGIDWANFFAEKVVET